MIYEVGISYPGNEYNQQVKLDLSKINININRLKFYYENNVIPYWIENYNNQIIWIKVPILNNNSKIYLTDEQSKDLSNGDNTFEFFDDFLGDTIDTNKWIIEGGGEEYLTISDSIIQFINQLTSENRSGIKTIKSFEIGTFVSEVYFRTSVSNLSLFHFNALSNDNWYADLFTHYTTDGQIDINYYTSPTDTSSVIFNVLNTTLWHSQYIYIKDNIYNFVYGGQNIKSFTMYVSPDPVQISFYEGTTYNGIGYVDYIFVRKYLPSDPQILYIKPYHKSNYYINTIFNENKNILNYNIDSYLETPVIESITQPSIQIINISDYNNNLVYIRGSSDQPDITESGVITDTGYNIRYWDSNNITNSGWNNTTPSQYIQYTSNSQINYNFYQFKIKMV